ncbi:ADP-ribosylation factor family-domain-containing protein [Scleroderma yunnanense]
MRSPHRRRTISSITTMGLLTIIRKSRQKEKEIRILFLGLDNAVLRLDSISKRLFIEGDVGGQRTLRPYWRNYFEQTDAIVWVVDSSDRVRIQDCKAELHNLLQEDVSSSRESCKIFIRLRYHYQRLTGASLLVFANKQDIQGSMSDKEIRNLLDLPGIKSHHWKIWPCSAVTGQNLVSGLDWVVEDVAECRLTTDHRPFPCLVWDKLDRTGW